MAVQVHVGKARLFTFTVFNDDGSVNTTEPATPGSGNTGTLRVTVNPSDPRQAAAVGLAPSSGVNAMITALGHTASLLFEVLALTGQSRVVIDDSNVGPEIDPPPWA